MLGLKDMFERGRRKREQEEKGEGEGGGEKGGGVDGEEGERKVRRILRGKQPPPEEWRMGGGGGRGCGPWDGLGGPSSGRQCEEARGSDGED